MSHISDKAGEQIGKKEECREWRIVCIPISKTEFTLLKHEAIQIREQSIHKHWQAPIQVAAKIPKEGQ